MLLRRIGWAIVCCIFAASLLMPAAKADTANTVAAAQTTNQAYTLSPTRLAKAIALDHIRNTLAFGVPAWSIAILLVVLALGWPARLRDWAERITPHPWLQGLIFLPIAILLLVVIPLPLAIYGHHVALAYGLSVERWSGWAIDQLKSWTLSLIAFVPLLLLLFWLIRRSPGKWWFWFWLCTIPLIVFAVFISPMWIDPMFNHFAPLEKTNPQLTAQLEQLAHHAGLDIPPSRIFLMRASEKVTGMNAYVTGIGASKRIVVWDTTIRALPPDEILFIAGHEMGHYVLGHIYKGLAFAVLVIFFGMWLVERSLRWLLRRHGTRWNIRGPGDWASLGVLALIFICLSFLFSPVANSFSRWEEHQADVYGQEAVHGLVADPQQTGERAFTALGSAYLEIPNPNPWMEFWFDSHPSLSSRFQFAEHYDPWLPGKHPRYFKK